MKTLKLLILSLLTGWMLNAQNGIPVPEMTSCDAQIQSFMNTFDIPSVTMALAKDGELKYMRSFGYANLAENEESQPYHMFRIASISKPITAIGIMKMVEDGTIALNDKVFGPGAILENHWYFSNSSIVDTEVYDITVQHLLEHSAGWDRSVNCFPNPTDPYPWFFSGCDPIVAPLHVTQSQGQSNPVKEEFLINYLLEKNLNFSPGTSYSYSNMGYLVLSEIIEEVSGMDYEAWMQQEIFHPLGIYDMYIGENLLEDKKEREGEYVGNGFTNLDLYGSGNTVPWEYGGFSVNAMDGHGGWIASARDMVRLLVAVDGFPTKPDILSPATITSMVTPSANNANYAKGWSVNSLNNWWHTGAIDGTASVWVRSNGGYTWAVVLNKRVVDSNATAFWNALDGMGWNCISSTANFPDFDLLDAPTVNASNLNVSGDEVSSMDLSWTNGNGTSRVVVMKDITNSTDVYNFSSYPIDGIDYTGNSSFGSGENLGDDTFVVYSGNNNQVTVTNLDPTKQYAMRVYEYRKTAANGNNALYLLGNPAEREAFLSVDGHELAHFVKVAPTITQNFVHLENNYPERLHCEIYDVSGRKLNALKVPMGKSSINFSAYQNGLYVMIFKSGKNSWIKKIIKK